jgi:hypothetical protein
VVVPPKAAARCSGGEAKTAEDGVCHFMTGARRTIAVSVERHLQLASIWVRVLRLLLENPRKTTRATSQRTPQPNVQRKKPVLPDEETRREVGHTYQDQGTLVVAAS